MQFSLGSIEGRSAQLTGICALLALVACGSEPIEEPVRRFAVADTTVVESLLPTIPDTLTPLLVQRYGMVDGPEEYLFGELHSFAVDGDGAVYVYESGRGIRIFGSDGQFQGHLARTGEGPGEVGHVSAMVAAGRGRVAVNDLGNRRVTVFEGRDSVWSVPLPPGQPPAREGALEFHHDGTLWAGLNPLYPEEGGITHPRPIFTRVTETGMGPDPVRTPSWIATHCPELSSWQHRRGFWEDNREPFIPKVKWGLGADGTLVVGCSATYRFYIIDPDGGVIRAARARRRVEVSQRERAFRAAMPVTQAGDYLPAYAKLIPTGDGRVWVWPTQPNVEVPLPPETADAYGVTHTWSIPWSGEFDVFTTDGDWIAVVRLPRDARYSGFPTEPNIVLRGDTLWAVEAGDLGVQTIARYVVPLADRPALDG